MIIKFKYPEQFIQLMSKFKYGEIKVNIKSLEGERMDKKTIATILVYVEKNCTEVEEVEEYLWKLLDQGTEFE